VPNQRRWRLTGAQHLAVVIAIVLSLFLSAMSLGMDTPVPLLLAAVILVVVGLGVFLLGLRFTSLAPIQTTAQVLTVSSPPSRNNIVGRCEMRLHVELDGAVRTVRVRARGVPLIKWPRPGMDLPIVVSRRNPRQMKIKWEAVAPRRFGPAAETEPVYAPTFYTEYAEGASAHTSPPDDIPAATGGGPTDGGLVVEETYVNDPFFREPDPVRAHPGLVLDGELVLSDTDTSAWTVRPDPVEVPPDAVEVPPESDDMPLLPVRVVPHQRSADPADETGTSAMGIMLMVSNLDRSVGFYRDMLDFTLVDRNAGSAVLAYRDGRVLLRRVADMSPVDRRVVHLHINVPDVNAAYARLSAKGVDFVRRPAVVNRGERLELWAATFRDPDGHAVALTQWRPRP
jgi:resuscitation-promoting factor RpfA